MKKLLVALLMLVGMGVVTSPSRANEWQPTVFYYTDGSYTGDGVAVVCRHDWNGSMYVQLECWTYEDFIYQYSFYRHRLRRIHGYHPWFYERSPYRMVVASRSYHSRYARPAYRPYSYPAPRVYHYPRYPTYQPQWRERTHTPPAYRQPGQHIRPRPEYRHHVVAPNRHAQPTAKHAPPGNVRHAPPAKPAHKGDKGKKDEKK